MDGGKDEIMNGKLIGAVLIVLSCGGFGFTMAASFRKEETALRQLIGALDYMQCELQFHLTPLPELCRKAGEEHRGIVGDFLVALSEELAGQTSAEVSGCMESVFRRFETLPVRIRKPLELLSASLGRFDAAGQISGLEAVRSHCRLELDSMAQNRENRLRSYQTLGLCAGAAIAILFV